MSFIRRVSLILISTFLLFVLGCRTDNLDKERTSTVAIKNSDVDFPGMQLRPGIDKESFTLVGRMRNRSVQHSISEVRLRITMEDVLATGATTTVGDTMVTLQQLLLPPGESKSFSENVLFKNLPSPKGRHEWKYSIVEISEQK
jgi:hypothetical protein